MHYHLAFGAFLTVLLIGLTTPGQAVEPGEHRVTGPYRHDNLSIYFLHGPSQKGPVPLTLEEAMRQGAVRLHETGSVSRLAIENTSDQEVFIQSGDIVKGGKQDRVLTISLILPPKSGRVPIAAFCVERGRWAARGKENLKRFATSSRAAPSRDLKLALRAPDSVYQGTARIQGVSPRSRAPASRQQRVWDSVKRTQDTLSRNVGEQIAAFSSPSSLQLALENKHLQKLEAGYMKILQSAGAKEADIIGFVFAINGKLNSAGLYSSNGLFRKMWPKLLRASVTEAIARPETGIEGTRFRVPGYRQDPGSLTPVPGTGFKTAAGLGQR